MSRSPWFALSIDYWRNAKVAEAGFLAGSLNIAAIGYCAEQLTDGFIPTMVVPILAAPMHGYVWVGEDGNRFTPRDVADSRGHSLAEDLVAAGLWEEVPGGYRIVNYLEHQPSRERVLANKEKARENGSKGGAARASKRSADQSADPSAKRSASDPLSASPSGTPSGTPSETQAPVPVPTPTEIQEKTLRSTALSLVASDHFDEWWITYPKRIGKKAARTAYLKAARTVSHEVLLEGARRYRDDSTRDPAYTAHAATWLNAGRWDDEGPTRPASQDARGRRVAPADVHPHMAHLWETS